MDPRLSLVTPGVRDLARARAFYEGLGWKASMATGEHVCFFQTGSMAVALYPTDALLNNAGMADSKLQPGGMTLGIVVAMPALS